MGDFSLPCLITRGRGYMEMNGSDIFMSWIWVNIIIMCLRVSVFVHIYFSVCIVDMLAYMHIAYDMGYLIYIYKYIYIYITYIYIYLILNTRILVCVQYFIYIYFWNWHMIACSCIDVKVIPNQRSLPLRKVQGRSMVKETISNISASRWMDVGASWAHRDYPVISFKPAILRPPHFQTLDYLLLEGLNHLTLVLNCDREIPANPNSYHSSFESARIHCFAA